MFMTDGTRYRFQAVGGRFRCKEIKDRNGNYISITHTGFGEIGSITDTLGRIVNFNYDSFNHLNSITQSWSGQTHT